MKEISNIKISCVFKLPLNWMQTLFFNLKRRNISFRLRGNIIIINDIFVICIIEKKDKNVHFNVTKIKKIENVFDFLFFFSVNYFSFDTKLLSLTIDNITASFNLHRKINLIKLRDYFQHFTFNPERFAGFFIKKKEGTIIIFRNGKVNIVGCKSPKIVEEIWKEIEPILQNCVITL